MNHNKRAIIPIIIVLALVGYGVYYVMNTYTRGQGLVVSGTIEVTEIHLGTQMGGLVNQVYAGEGETVSAGQVLVEIQPAAVTSVAP